MVTLLACGASALRESVSLRGASSDLDRPTGSIGRPVPAKPYGSRRDRRRAREGDGRSEQSALRLKRRRFAPRHAAAGEAFREVAAGPVEMAEAAAEFPGAVEPRDGNADRVEHAPHADVHRP